MSLTIAEAWIQSTIHEPGAQRDAIGLFRRADAKGVDGTLLVAPELTRRGRGYLARWTADELLVLELTRRQLQSLDVKPATLFQQVGGVRTMPEIPCDLWLTLSDIRFDFSGFYDCSEPLTGSCRYAFDTDQPQPLREPALHVEYFRPDLPGVVTCLSYPPGPLSAPCGEVKFHFASILPEVAPASPGDTMILFLQLYMAQDWVNQRECQRVSNAAVVAIDIR